MFQKLFRKESAFLFVWLIGIYGFHYLLRVWSSPNFGDSDAFQALALSQLNFDYQNGVGPLYTWLLHFAVLLFGYSVSSFLVVKYVLLIGLYFSYYFSYLLFGSDKKYAVLSAMSLGSLYFLMWRIHEVITDRLVTTLISMLAFYIFFKKEKNKKFDWAYVLIFGLVLGLGFLTEVYFIIPVIIFLILSVDSGSGWKFREVAGSVALGGFFASPFIYWLLENQTLNLFLMGGDHWTFVASWGAFRSALLHPIYVLSPAILFLLPLLFAKQVGLRSEYSRVMEFRLIKYLSMSYVVWVLYFGFWASLKNTEAHTAMVVFLPLLIPVFVRLESTLIGYKKIVAMLFIFPMVAVFFRLGNLLVEEPFCRNCRWSIPYTELAHAIETSFDSPGTLNVCSHNPDLLANLKRSMPNFNYSLLSVQGDAQECSTTSGYLEIEESPLDVLSDSEEFKQCYSTNDAVMLRIRWADPHWPVSDPVRRRFSVWRVKTNLAISESCKN